jgi:acetylornithine deacetylase
MRFITAGLGRQGEHPAAVAARNRRGVPEDDIPSPCGVMDGLKGFPPRWRNFFVSPIPSLPLPAAAALKLLTELCARDSSSGQESGILPALLPALTRRGARVDIQELGPQRCNVLATWGEPRVIFTTHLDTVPPFLPPSWDGEALHGRGACDAKGQMAAQLLALDQLREQGFSGLGWLGLAGEETDSLGAQKILAWKDRFTNALALINGEPTDLRVATGQRGVENLRLTCQGRAAHGGSPELGHNAILDLMDWLERVRRLALGQDAELGPEVWNLGTIRGGEAVNIVPAQAEAWLNVRTVPASTFRQRVEACKPPGGTLEVLLSDPPCRFKAIPGFDRAPMPFGSDAPALQALIPSGTIVLAGPGSITCAHTDQERLSMASLLEGVDLFRRLGLHFLGSRP